MKKLFFTAILTSLLTLPIFSQAIIAYVDSDAIMENLPDAQDAREKLDLMIQEWQTELNKMESEWEKKYDEYEKRKLIMTDKTRAEFENDLVKLEKEIAEYRENKFGANGELFQKQDELMRPIQNRIFNVIQEIAEEEDYDFVFDRSGDVMLLYAKEEHDITNEVINRMQL